MITLLRSHGAAPGADRSSEVAARGNASCKGEKGAQKKQKIDKDEASVAKKGTQKKEEAEKEAAPISKEVQKDKGASAAKSKANL